MTIDPATVRIDVLIALDRGARTVRQIAATSGYSVRVVQRALADLRADGRYRPSKPGRPRADRVHVLPGETVEAVMARTGASLHIARESVAEARPEGTRSRSTRALYTVERDIAAEVDRHARVMDALAWELERARRREAA